MWQQINDNKIKSLFGMILIFAFFILFGAALGYVFFEDAAGALIGIITMVFIYIFCLLNVSNKSPEDLFEDRIFRCFKRDNATVYNIVEEMSIASGLGYIPKVYILDTRIPNAFAFGIRKKQMSVIVTKGLLKMLNRDELQGVIAHEIAHIKNEDTSLLLKVSMVIMAISAILNSFASGRGIRCSYSSGSSSKNNGAGILLLIAIVFIIVSPIIANMFYFFISRKREYLADACAVQYTRYPTGLACALAKISKATERYEDETNKELSENALLNASCIIAPKKKKEGDNLFSTHPTTENRIKILTSMTSADYLAYNSAYSNITLQKAGIIKQEALKDCKTIPITESLVQQAGVTALAGVSTANRTLKINENQEAESKKQRYDEKVDRTRETEDLLWKLAGYRTIECECGTKIKIPPCYTKLEFKCPHCKKLHKI